MTVKINGVHHLAVCTRDIKAQIEFFSDVLGAELVALYWMHGVEGAWHGFVKLHDTSYLAFVQTDGMAEIEPELGVTHAGWAGGDAAGGTMQHVAFNVDNEEDLLTLRDRIRSRGINVWGPVDHGMCKSMYFAGLEDLTLEVATSEAPVDARAWIDPEVVELAGISPDELAAFTSPARYAGEGGTIPQPPVDPSKPHSRGMSPERYQRSLTTPDDVISQPTRFSKPPVEVD
ncbi:MAG: VOC family protein [Actinomycetia bacterium]|nr:VOC family protein [Actinomycetes bacterium]MCP4962090.1 VOC family protein [Actinomycetes bacterium]